MLLLRSNDGLGAEWTPTGESVRVRGLNSGAVSASGEMDMCIMCTVL